MPVWRACKVHTGVGGILSPNRHLWFMHIGLRKGRIVSLFFPPLHSCTCLPIPAIDQHTCQLFLDMHTALRKNGHAGIPISPPLPLSDLLYLPADQ